MNRRHFLSQAALAPLCAAFAPAASELSVAGYIFQQYAQKRNETLSAVLPAVLTMVAAAGFRNLELSSEFFAPAIRHQTVGRLQAKNLRTPSLYVGGTLHTEGEAEQTLRTALEIATLGTPLGCKAIVHNPSPKPGSEPKTDAELATQAQSLNRLGRTLAEHGVQLRVHHHTPELSNNAREWRHILHHTDPQWVGFCLDVDWAYESGVAPLSLIQEAGRRLRELHIRSAKDQVWLEQVEDSDIDYAPIASYLRGQHLSPLLVVELAYRPQTVITRSLPEDLRRSRLYTQKAFQLSATQ